MKNKILKFFTTTSLIAVAIVAFNLNTNNLNQNDITLENIAALNTANAENDNVSCITFLPGTCSFTCGRVGWPY